MEKPDEFGRCIYCFEPRDTSGPCPKCGYDNGLCSPLAWWLSPGTILKGRYVVGQHLKSTREQLTYLGWDLRKACKIKIVEYFPEAYVTRDITHSDAVSCIPGCMEALENGRQAFFERAKLYYICTTRVSQALDMDFFFRNNTCYCTVPKRETVPGGI